MAQSFFTIFNPLTIGYAYGIILYANKTNIINKTTESTSTCCVVPTIINCLAVGTLCGVSADLYSKFLPSDSKNILISSILFLLLTKELYELYKIYKLKK